MDIYIAYKNIPTHFGTLAESWRKDLAGVWFDLDKALSYADDADSLKGCPNGSYISVLHNKTADEPLEN